MGVGANKLPVWFTTCAVLSAVVSSALGQCSDGTYEHEGLDCCKCAAGQYLVSDCNTNLTRGQCDICKPGSYNSHPNADASCEPCTSCSQSNDNLEVEEHCTPGRDTKCRCKKDHYCVSGAESCKLCQRCKECAHGVKVSCSGYNDTTCNDKSSNVGLIAGIIVAVFISVCGGIALFVWQRKRCKSQEKQLNPVELTNITSSAEETQLLQDMDLMPLLPAIAEVIGWQDLHNLALSSNIPPTIIDSCKLDCPGNSQDQTVKLLMAWTERQGMRAGTELIKSLQKSNKTRKAEQVKKILLEAAGQNPPA